MKMNGSDQTNRDAEYLARARALATLIEKEADTCERQGTLSAPLIQAFRDAELFWMQFPVEFGGGGVSLAGGIEVWEEVTRADGSAGWTLMANGGQTLAAAAFLGPAAFDEMFGGGRKSIVGGMLAPIGRAVMVPGGYKGGGKYAFGSGIAHADWIGAGMMVMDGNRPLMMPNGMPTAKMTFVPKSTVTMLGGWDVIGLIGTGSYDYEVAEQFVPEDFTMDRVAPPPRRGGPFFNVGPYTLGTAGHVAVALGLAKRALQEVVRATRGKKRPGYPTDVASNDVFKQQFSIAEATYQATRDYVLRSYAKAQASVMAGEPFSDEHQARTRQSATWAHKTCSDVVRFAHEWSGSKSIRNPSVLGRVTRDMAVATQHAFVDPVTLTDAAEPIMQAWLRAMDDNHGVGTIPSENTDLRRKS